jgi:hypothetical protein
VGGDLGVQAEAVFPDRQLPEQRGRHQFQAAVQVADPGVEQRVRGEGVHPVADDEPERVRSGGAEGAHSVYHLRIAALDRGEQVKQVLGTVFQVGVEDDQVVTAGHRGRGPDGRALAPVVPVPANDQPWVVDGRQHLARVVPAAIVYDDKLDITRITDPENPLDREPDGGRLVVGRHQDGQFHMALTRLMPAPAQQLPWRWQAMCHAVG